MDRQEIFSITDRVADPDPVGSGLLGHPDPDWDPLSTNTPCKSTFLETVFHCLKCSFGKIIFLFLFLSVPRVVIR